MNDEYIFEAVYMDWECKTKHRRYITVNIPKSEMPDWRGDRINAFQHAFQIAQVKEIDEHLWMISLTIKEDKK